MSVRIGRIFKHRDMTVNREFDELYRLIYQRKFTSDSLDMEEIRDVLGRTLRPGELRVIERLLRGEDNFHRIFIDGDHADSFASLEIRQLDTSGVEALIANRTNTTGSLLANRTCLFIGDDDHEVVEIDHQSATRTGGCLKLTNSGTGNTINDSTGANLDKAGAWNNASSRSIKQRFESVGDTWAIETVKALPVTRYQYKQDETKEHLGPVAEDFFEQTGLGDSTTISSADLAGLALRGLQAMIGRYERLTDRVLDLEDRLREQEAKHGH